MRFKLTLLALCASLFMAPAALTQPEPNSALQLLRQVPQVQSPSSTGALHQPVRSFSEQGDYVEFDRADTLRFVCWQHHRAPQTDCSYFKWRGRTIAIFRECVLLNRNNCRGWTNDGIRILAFLNPRNTEDGKVIVEREGTRIICDPESLGCE